MTFDWFEFLQSMAEGTETNHAIAERFETMAAGIREFPFEAGVMVSEAMAHEPNGAAILQRHIRAHERLLQSLKDLRAAIVSHPASRIRAES
ncbi:MAG TPA: hypothetical protein VH253_10970 [Phycisphaerae bacterium]|nr:hypothetical protein [Phycisphaerae bacterium]